MRRPRSRPRLAAAGIVALLAATAAAAQPDHVDEWRTAVSPHFRIHSEAAPERTAEIVATLEAFRAVFAGLAAEIELTSSAPTRIYAFRDADGYSTYKTAADRRGVLVLGQFLSHRDGNFITLNADPRYLGAFAVVLHEYVHYLVQQNFPRAPRWFNEGLAEYYSTFAVEGGRAVIGRPVERHQRWLARNAELGLAEVLAAPRRDRDDEALEEGRFYAVSWALVHYLLSRGDETAPALAAFLARGADGPTAVALFEESFGLRLDEMEKRLRRYLLGSEVPVAVVSLESLGGVPRVEAAPADAAELLTGLGDLLSRMERETEAERHYDLALEYRPGYADALAGLGHLRDRQGRLEEADALFREAIAAGGGGALTHLLYGRHLVGLVETGAPVAGREGRSAVVREARDVFELATRLDPGFAEPEAMLGAVHLLGGGLEPADGVAPLERATARLPGRVDLLFYLLQAYLRADRRGEAEALAGGAIATFGDEREAAAREEIERWTLIRSADRALAAGEVESGLDLLGEAISVTTDPGLRARLVERFEEIRAGAAGRGPTR